MVEFDGNKQLKDLKFTHASVWISVFDLPLGMMNSSTGWVIGNSVGKALLVDAEVDGSAVGGHLLIKVRVDIRKPLMHGIMVEDDEGCEGQWCPF